MRWVLILLFYLALLGAACASRPSETSFRACLAGGRPAGAATDPAGGYHYKNRILWADVEKDGRTVYTGAFSHWYEH